MTPPNPELDRLLESERLFRTLFASNPLPMWVYDLETLRFLEVNTAAIGHYGYRREEFLSMTVSDLLPLVDRLGLRGAPDDPLGESPLGESPLGGTPVGDPSRRADGMPESPRRHGAFRHLVRDGRTVDVELTTHRLQFSGRDAVLVAVQDVTERNELERQLRHHSFHDGLTNLANRALFLDRVEHSLNRRHGEGTPTVALLDLDEFKTVNDSLGHAAGDRLLVAVAARLRQCLRAGDTGARLGGDEFALLLEDIDNRADAMVLIERVLLALAAPFDLDGREVFVRASAGIALGGDDVTTAGHLLRNADAAMYAAKSTAKGSLMVFETQMHDAALRRLELESALRAGLREDQLFLQYQPQVSLHTGAVVGAESLIRWRHPTLGVLGPNEFIPLAEETGIIIELGDWVLREACRQLAIWQECWAHPGFRLAINLSARQLADPKFPDRVEAVLAQTGARPSGLLLELTESMLMTDTQRAQECLRRMRDLGIAVSLDDFGTGYSSLSYVRAFAVDELKIERGFVANLGTTLGDPDLVSAIIGLGHTLGLRTVAEGVESEAQAAILRQLGCKVAQGYLFAKPLPVDQMDELIRRPVPPFATVARFEAPATAVTTAATTAGAGGAHAPGSLVS